MNGRRLRGRKGRKRTLTVKGITRGRRGREDHKEGKMKQKTTEGKRRMRRRLRVTGKRRRRRNEKIMRRKRKTERRRAKRGRLGEED